MTDYSSYVWERREKARYILSAAITLFITGYIFFGNIPVGFLFSAGSVFYPRYKASDLIRKRKAELNLQFKDALYSLSSSLSAGKSLESAFRAALKDLQVLYPEPGTPIIRELEYVCRRMELNDPVELTLQDFARRSGLEDIRNFADVVSICKRTGGNMVQVVKNTSGIIGDRIEIAQDIELILARQKFEQKILNVMPVIFIGLIKFGGSGYMDSLYVSAGGYLLMAAALSVIFISHLIARQIVDIEV